MKRRPNIPIGTARIAQHPTPNCARMEPGFGAKGRGSGATSLSCTLGREMEVEVELALRGGRRQAEHISVSVGFRESGPWRFLRGMGKIEYY